MKNAYLILNVITLAFSSALCHAVSLRVSTRKKTKQANKEMKIEKRELIR